MNTVAWYAYCAMGFFSRFLARSVLCGIALLIARQYVSGFELQGDVWGLTIAALVLALLNAFLKPLVKLVTAPLIWLTFGLFHVVIHIGLLWLADILLPQFVFHDILSLMAVALLVAAANMFI